jgi:adenylate cyclase
MKKFLIILSLLSIPLIFQWDMYQVLKLRTFDNLVLPGTSSGYFSVLNITEEDIDREGGYPLPRYRLAEIQHDLLEHGAIGVGWAIGFPHPDRLGGDEAFAYSMSFSKTVLPLFEYSNGEYPDTVGTVILGEEVGGFKASGTLQNIPILRESAWTEQGIATAPVDIDNLVRRIPLLYKTPDGWLASFGTQILKTLLDVDTYVIKTNENGIEEVRVRGLPPVKTDSLGRKWVSWIVPHETSLQNMDVEGKFVIVGTDAAGIMPQLATPVGLLEPHYIQAALAESILQPNSPHIPDYALAVELAIFITTVSLVWAAIVNFNILIGATIFVVTILGAAALGVTLIQKGILIDVTWAIISQILASTVAYFINFRTQYRLRQQIKKQFEHYLDPRQVKRLQKNPDLLKLGGETRYCTFLFTDVRGFTALSESLPPEKVTYIMNKALTAQQAAVQQYSGTVDKYIGDAMMAFWNAPFDQDDHEKLGVDCALQIVENLKELNEELQAEGLAPVAIGIGVNSGAAVIGNMGSNTRFDYTAIGDAVNTAARLESATKDQNATLLIGKSTANKCKRYCRFVNDISVKGKSDKLQVFTASLDVL